MRNTATKKAPRGGPFDRFLGAYGPEVDASIRDFYTRKLDSAPMEFMREIYADLKEYCLRDGKRIRPIILLASFQGFARGRGQSMRGVVKIGAALELMHSFLLVQDDIIDKSASRRGGDALHVTCGKRYRSRSANPLVGSDVALVAGDVLFANALEMVSESGIDRENIGTFLKYFSHTYEYTAWGQIYDSLNAMPADIETSAGSALDISTLKTAYYTVYYPMVMGYVLTGGRARKTIRLIRDAAIPLGLAFQLRDDILGVFGDSGKTGKPADSDIREGKMTALVMHTLKNAQGRSKKEFTRLFLKHRKSAPDVARVRSIIRSCGALDAVHSMVRANAREARNGVRKLGFGKKSEAVFDGLIEKIEDVQTV